MDWAIFFCLSSSRPRASWARAFCSSATALARSASRWVTTAWYCSGSITNSSSPDLDLLALGELALLQEPLDPRLEFDPVHAATRWDGWGPTWFAG